jgi:uncharacterized protein YcbK (DUF882 family)
MDRRLFMSLAAWIAAAPARAYAIPVPAGPRRLDLVNAHTGETFSGPYRDAAGPIPSAMSDVSQLLRDFHCGASIPIDVDVLDFLANVMEAVGLRTATVLSAYRTPETNEMLARTVFGVAEHSQHMYGRAIDICFPAHLEEAMTTARMMKCGGVGWYPRSGFIHIDSGPVRNWDLDGDGFGQLLLGDGTPRLTEPLRISPDGDLVVGHTRRPAGATDRLALHQMLEKVIGASHGR